MTPSVLADQMDDATRRLREQAWMITIPTDPVIEPEDVVDPYG
jgi:hypothetical protein